MTHSSQENIQSVNGNSVTMVQIAEHELVFYAVKTSEKVRQRHSCFLAPRLPMHGHTQFHE